MQTTRGLLAALVFCICACAPAPGEPAPQPGTPEAALHALCTGDQEQLRAGLGKFDGLLSRARELQQCLDPEAWRVALGAVTRQTDMPNAAAALREGDESGLRAALGFSDQALATDILNATNSVAQKRAGDRYYYSTTEPATAAFEEWALPKVPAHVAAYHVTALATRGERRVRIHFGRDGRGLTDLRAAVDIAGAARVAPVDHRASTAADLMPMATYGLDCAWLDDPCFTEASVYVLDDGGTLCHVRLVRVDDEWGRVEATSRTLSQRLAEMRDARLIRIRHTASEYAMRNARWPGQAALVTLRPADWVDPTDEHARFGWAEFDAHPPRGFELLQARAPDDVAVIALRRETAGRRAINRKGELLWQ
jgi:hypothetical protein